jgi:NAD(P)-dependent dehydrogenase (short-subunit alcohol dehydrogenase family)
MSDLVVIVGAGPGLGRAIGAAFTASGARVVVLARDEARLASMTAEIGGAGWVTADVTDELALRVAFAEVRAAHGDPDVLVHNPSVAYVAPPTKTSWRELMAGFAVAPGSLLVAAQEVAPAMRKAGRGTILVTGGASARTGSTWSAALGAQKAALRNLAQSLAAELGPDGIRVATITIDGILGQPGLEHDRIAAECVRLHDLAHKPDTEWQPEITWPPQPAD